MSCNNRSPKTEQGRNLFICSHCNSRLEAGSRQTTTRCARCRPCIRSHILLAGPLPDNGSIIFPLYLTASNAGKSKCELGLHFERPLHCRRPIASLSLSPPPLILLLLGSLQPRRSGHVEQFSGHRRQTCHTFAPQHGRWPAAVAVLVGIVVVVAAAVVAPYWLCQPQKFVTRHAATPHLERLHTTLTHTRPLGGRVQRPSHPFTEAGTKALYMPHCQLV